VSEASALEQVVAGHPALCWGDADAPLALCLHGFPDVPHTFHTLAPTLVGAGYRVVAPYLPGYAPSPRLRRADLASVAAVLASLAADLSPGRPYTLVGHDWGAALGYALSARDPSRVSALVSLAVPHPAAFTRTWLRSSAQRRASAYMLAFQLPGANARICAHEQQAVEQLWRRWSPGFAPDAAHLSRVKRCLADSRGAPLDYYRHNLRPLVPALRSLGQLSGHAWRTPTLHLHGADDGCMLPSCAQEWRRMLERRPVSASTARAEVEVLGGAGHFLHLERPDDVAARVLAFVRQSSCGS